MFVSSLKPHNAALTLAEGIDQAYRAHFATAEPSAVQAHDDVSSSQRVRSESGPFSFQRSTSALAVTGQFGTNTLAIVNALQQQNHLKVTGILGPETWKLAWTGSYRKPAAVPTLTGAQYYSRGDHSAAIRTWQLQMRSRGVALAGTGQFGTDMVAVVQRIQRVNHLNVTGILGPETWKLAWLGAY